MKRRAFLEASAGVFLGGESSFVSRLVEDKLRETLVEEVATRIRGDLTYRGESQ